MLSFFLLENFKSALGSDLFFSFSSFFFPLKKKNTDCLRLLKPPTKLNEVPPHRRALVRPLFTALQVRRRYELGAGSRGG